MANNCLKTQLKDAVDNSNLLKLGELILNVQKLSSEDYTHDGSRLLFRVPLGQSVTFKVIGNGFFVLDWDTMADESTHLTEVTISGTDVQQMIYMANENFKLSVNSKYIITLLGNSRGRSPQSSNIIVELKDLEYATKITELNCGLSTTRGDVKYLEKMADLVDVNLWNNNGIVGNITSFGKLTKITNNFWLSDTEVDGAIEDFCDMQVEAGRTSGTITLHCSKNLTYQGNALANRAEKVIRFGSSMVNPTEQETTQGWQVV